MLGTAVDVLGMAQKDALIKIVYTVAWRNGSVVTSTCRPQTPITPVPRDLTVFPGPY